MSKTQIIQLYSVSIASYYYFSKSSCHDLFLGLPAPCFCLSQSHVTHVSGRHLHSKRQNWCFQHVKHYTALHVCMLASGLVKCLMLEMIEFGKLELWMFVFGGICSYWSLSCPQVFYPDLIAKRKTPEYTLVCMSPVIPHSWCTCSYPMILITGNWKSDSPTLYGSWSTHTHIHTHTSYTHAHTICRPLVQTIKTSLFFVSTLVPHMRSVKY